MPADDSQVVETTSFDNQNQHHIHPRNARDTPVMNQLRSWLYGHHVSVQDKHTRGAGLSPDAQDERQPQDRSGQLENIDAGQLGSHQSAVRSALLKVIPLAPGDCLECKIVGTGVMMLSGVMVLTAAFSARKSLIIAPTMEVLSLEDFLVDGRNPRLAGLHGTAYMFLCSSLFVGLQAAAFCRLFDVGPFDKNTGQSVTTRKTQ